MPGYRVPNDAEGGWHSRERLCRTRSEPHGRKVQSGRNAKSCGIQDWRLGGAGKLLIPLGLDDFLFGLDVDTPAHFVLKDLMQTAKCGTDRPTDKTSNSCSSTKPFFGGKSNRSGRLRNDRSESSSLSAAPKSSTTKTARDALPGCQGLRTGLELSPLGAQCLEVVGDEIHNGITDAGSWRGELALESELRWPIFPWQCRGPVQQ